MRTVAELWRFAKGHWHVPLLLPPMLIVFTILHEAAHALAVLLQGGRVTEFVWLPSRGEWGHIRYTFPNGVSWDHRLIALAPYLLALAAIALALLLCLRRRPWPHTIASMIFAWLYLAPLAELANVAGPWLLGKPNDLAAVIPHPRAAHTAILVTAAFVAVALGWPLQRRLYRDHALSTPAYLLAVLLFALVIAGVLWVF